MGRALGVGILLAAMVAVPACVAVGGNSSENRPTQGQELIDLKTALDRGAVSQAEYDQAKAKLLAKH